MLVQVEGDTELTPVLPNIAVSEGSGGTDAQGRVPGESAEVSDDISPVVGWSICHERFVGKRWQKAEKNSASVR